MLGLMTFTLFYDTCQISIQLWRWVDWSVHNSKICNSEVLVNINVVVVCIFSMYLA